MVIGGIEVVIMGFVFIFVALVLLILWLWMLIDHLKRQDDKFAIGENNTKLIWGPVIIFTGFIEMLLYYFLLKEMIGDRGGIT